MGVGIGGYSSLEWAAVLTSYLTRGLRPGAAGLFLRGELLFAALTLRSNSDFGTARSLRMMPWKFSNSGVEVKASLAFMRHLRFTDQLIVGETATNDLAHCEYEAISVRHVPVVVAVDFFVKIPEQVEGLNTNVGAFQRALEQAPEVFQPVRANVAVDVFNGVVNHLMLKFGQTVSSMRRIAWDVNYIIAQC